MSRNNNLDQLVEQIWARKKDPESAAREIAVQVERQLDLSQS